MADIDDNLGDWSDLVSIELFSALADGLNRMIDGVGVGEIATIIVIPGMTPPLDPTIWQKCVGGTVTEPLSPIRGQAVPDMRDLYLKGAQNLSTVGIISGSHTQNFGHSHGGQTQGHGTGGNIVDASSGYWEAVGHAHGMSGDLNYDMDMQPKRFHIEHYLKIR